jgi:Fic family protein
MIVNAFAQIGVTLKPVNPFELDQPTLAPSRERSPYVLRLRSIWASWRAEVIQAFPPAPGLKADAAAYLHAVDERYTSDAYNSLSIEGYQVTDALIERVARGDWNPDEDSEQAKTRDALAARGYYQAFQAVKASIGKVLGNQNAGDVVKVDHHDWYAQLFGPAVQAGILTRSQIVGYRTGPIYIRNSMHTPVPREAILDALDALWELISEEPEASVRAVLGHHLFVFIHPYFDGNGRIGRFLMNTLLASGGYPWTVIRVSRRAEYMQALEEASVRGKITPLAAFIAQEMQG